MKWKLRWLWCFLFGHNDDFYDSGYPVCGRCGLHSYWHSRHIDEEATPDYDQAGVLLRPYWKLCDATYRWRERRRWARHDDDLPF